MRRGANWSMRCRRTQSRSRLSASPSSSSLSASSRVLPANAGLSHCSRVASRAVVGQVWQAELGHPFAQTAHPLAPLRERLGPRQRVEPEFAHRIAQRLRRLGGIGTSGRPTVEHDALEAALATGDQRAGRRVPTHRVLLDEAIREVMPQARFVHRSGAQDQRVLGLVTQLHQHQPRLAKYRAVIEQPRTAAVGELVTARVAGVLVGDAIGECVRQQIAERMRGHCGGRRCVAVQAAAPLCRCLIDRSQRSTIGIAWYTAAAKRRQGLPARHQGIAATAQRIARFDQGRQIAGQCTRRAAVGDLQHRGQAWMGAECEHAPPKRGDAGIGIQCAKPLQQVATGRQGAGRRRIDEAQRRTAPGRQFQHQRRQLDLRDFRACAPPPVAATPATAGSTSLPRRGRRDRRAGRPRPARWPRSPAARSRSSGRSAARVRARCRLPRARPARSPTIRPRWWRAPRDGDRAGR